MKLNKLVFPAPQPSYSSEKLQGKLIYIPRNALKEEESAAGATSSFFSSISASSLSSLEESKDVSSSSI